MDSRLKNAGMTTILFCLNPQDPHTTSLLTHQHFVMPEIFCRASRILHHINPPPALEKTLRTLPAHGAARGNE
jgi:hypothetical protein